VRDWENRWDAAALQFICQNSHMVLLLPAAPVLEAEEAARAEEADRPYFGHIIGDEEPDPIAELLRPEWTGQD
jgi:hypothetical protein